MSRALPLLFLSACIPPSAAPATTPPADGSVTTEVSTSPQELRESTSALGAIPRTALSARLLGGELVMVVLPGGGVSSHLATEPPPTQANVRLADCDAPTCRWSLQSASGGELFTLGPDGVFRMGPGADFLEMSCRLEGEALACTCDGHSPEIDLRCSVHGAQVTCQRGMFSAAGADLDPAPESREERVRALFLLAEILMSHDAAEHDGDADVFGPEY